jgi:diguanylate cyclase (GGDEF)-like protein
VSVLIVDDSPATRDSLRALLQSHGYTDVLDLPSGEAALALLYGEGAPPVDVILMDVDMPGGADGIETCRRIKASPSLRDIPILIIIDLSQEKALEPAFAAGACDYIARPVQVTELLARLRAALVLKRERDQCKARQSELLESTRQLQQLNEELQRLAVIDELTGISNRRFFNMVLGQEWGRATREVHPLSLILIDIDSFKNYNDYYGHQKGDECLRRVARALSELVRRPGDQVARYGGEEFVVLMPHTGLRGAAGVAEKLRQQIEELNLEHARSDVSNRVTISLGVASAIPERGSSPEQLIAAADRAGYEAKRLGRNRVHVYEGSLEPATSLFQGPHRPL